jgi:hypothetical protein
MTTAIFLLYLLGMLAGWVRWRRLALGCFALATIAACLWLGHHMTDPLGLQL